MIRLEPVVLVEGKYDKIKLERLLDATILTTDGFGIFHQGEKLDLLRRLARERGLLDFCQQWELPVRFYSAEELRQVPGTFAPSEFVKSITGVDNVCERAAMLGARSVIVHKTAMDGVTVALAEKAWEVVF